MDQEDEIKGLLCSPIWTGFDLAARTDACTTTVPTERESDSSLLTLDSIRRAVRIIEDHDREIQRELLANIAGGLYNPFNSVRVVESPLIKETRKPNRLHKKRRNQSESYHNRIQKKWNKRFGTKPQIPTYFIYGGEFGLGSAVVMHPNVARMMRESGAMRVFNRSLCARKI